MMAGRQKCDLPDGLIAAARHLQQFKEENALTDQSLAAICTRAAAELYPDRNIRVHRSRISRILACANPAGSGRMPAPVLVEHEQVILAHVIGITRHQLIGLDDSSDA